MVYAEQLNVQIDQTMILQNITLRAEPGEFIGLIGPNGSGKSTMLRTLIGFAPLSSGQLLVADKPINDYRTRDIACLIGYVPQDTTVDFAFKAQDIVLMGRHPHRPRFALESRKDQQIAQEAMRMTDTLHLANRFITHLSGGQRQMIFIAKALAQQPRILLLDEPISALDIRYQLRVLELIRRLTDDGMTAIAALHDLNLAARFCDRLFLLHHGQLIRHGSPEEVLTPPVIRQAYGVEARVQADPWVGSPSVTAIHDQTD